MLEVISSSSPSAVLLATAPRYLLLDGSSCIGLHRVQFNLRQGPQVALIVARLRVGSVMVPSLGLQDFLLRARVLKLYRRALRIAHRAPDHARAELRKAIRQEVETNRDCRDRQRIRFLISDGLERVKNLDEMLDMQGH
ncbi:hypothetical protein SAY86_012423 [Trapa natans]|uniref:LYR motif-containing protein 2 n=1 Tax=Trapa natans TaxID=22666 RepID=A0AAN7LZU7_TRANT|nr:hypothetical protein SAY86_012423 [Trapa natans]